MIRSKYKRTALRIGLRVGVVSGPGQFPEDRPGRIVEKDVNRWGTHWQVEMADGSEEWISALETTEMGIGWYAIEEST
ncbi:hypothetical protein [Caballeronia sp. LZ003]|uniref:hypothetical protein n=1 Tax=Caballeronia sp. LZ003 TaxID=3038559 RepID=UPI00286282A4|nr:hypothetical protein [Caballeronia sp. LZ003]MDR5776967.1 hypothetical protein [Caballeronia sp. LZ002]MDR5852458.1 hypothetical protein [Caballeronia sp. LZ003]